MHSAPTCASQVLLCSSLYLEGRNVSLLPFFRSSWSVRPPQTSFKMETPSIPSLFPTPHLQIHFLSSSKHTIDPILVLSFHLRNVSGVSTWSLLNPNPNSYLLDEGKETEGKPTEHAAKPGHPNLGAAAACGLFRLDKLAVKASKSAS